MMRQIIVPLVFLCYLFFFNEMVPGHCRPPQFRVAAVKTHTGTTDERQHEPWRLETKKAGWYCNCEWIVPLNWLLQQCNINKSLCNTVTILIKTHQSRYASMFCFFGFFSHSPLSLMNCNTTWCQPWCDSSEGTAAERGSWPGRDCFIPSSWWRALVRWMDMSANWSPAGTYLLKLNGIICPYRKIANQRCLECVSELFVL